MPSFAHNFGFYMDGDTLCWAQATGIRNIWMWCSYMDGKEEEASFPEDDCFSEDECLSKEAENWETFLNRSREYAQKYVLRGRLALTPDVARAWREMWDEAMACSATVPSWFPEYFAVLDGEKMYYADARGDVSVDYSPNSGELRYKMKELCRAVVGMGMMGDCSPSAMDWLRTSLKQLREETAELKRKMPTLKVGEQAPIAEGPTPSRPWLYVAPSMEDSMVNLDKRDYASVFSLLFPGKGFQDASGLVCMRPGMALGLHVEGDMLYWAKTSRVSQASPYSLNAPVSRGCMIIPPALKKELQRMTETLEGRRFVDASQSVYVSIAGENGRSDRDVAVDSAGMTKVLEELLPVLEGAYMVPESERNVVECLSKTVAVWEAK